jgi:hypothetical protein
MQTAWRLIPPLVDAADRIVVATTRAQDSSALTRLTANGQRDASFGSNGLATMVPVGALSRHPSAIAFHDGRVLVLGSVYGPYTYAAMTLDRYLLGPSVLRRGVLAFGASPGGDVAMGDVDGDGFDETIRGARAGTPPIVSVFRGSALIASFLAYDRTFSGGVNVTAGDLDGDGKAEIITGPASNGPPLVRIFGGTGSLRGGFLAYTAAFTGGVDVAFTEGGDHGDSPSIITGPGPGGAPRVRVFDRFGQPAGAGFMAFSPTFRGGIRVASIQLSATAFGVVVGAAAGGGPSVRAFALSGTPVGNEFYAFASSFTGGVDVSSVRRRNGTDAIVASSGLAMAPSVRLFELSGAAASTTFPAGPSNLSDGLRVAGGLGAA